MYYIIILLIIILCVIFSIFYIRKYNYEHLKRGTTYDDNMGNYIKKLNKKFKKKKRNKIYKNDDVTEFNEDFFNFKNNVNQISEPYKNGDINLEQYHGMKIKDIYDDLIKN